MLKHLLAKTIGFIFAVVLGGGVVMAYNTTMPEENDAAESVAKLEAM